MYIQYTIYIYIICDVYPISPESHWEDFGRMASHRFAPLPEPERPNRRRARYLDHGSISPKGRIALGVVRI